MTTAPQEEQPFKVERLDPRDVNIAYDKDGPVEVENTRTGETWTREQGPSTAPQEADEVRRIREAVLNEMRDEQVAGHIDDAIALLDAFERAVEAAVRLEAEAEARAWRDARERDYAAITGTIANDLKAAEARLSRLEAAARDLLKARSYEPDRSGLEQDWYGRYSCGCSWDSGPFETFCEEHSSSSRIETAIEALRAALKAGEETQ